MTIAALPATVETVYDAITDSSRWPAALESVCGHAQGCMAMLGVVDTAQSAARFSVLHGEARLVDPLIARYGSNVPFYSAISRMEIDVPYTADTMYDLQGTGARQAWLESPMARDWVIPNNLDDFFWVALMKQQSRAGNLVIITDKQRRPITRDDLELVGQLAPHVRRAVVIGDLFESERRTAAMFRAIIESFAHPVLIVGAGLEILFANRAAEELLAEGVAVASLSGQLSFAYAPARAAVARAVETSLADEFSLGSAGINVPLARVKAPAVAHVMPLSRRDPSARFAERAAAAIFIGMAGMTPLPAMQAIAALFGLTAAETRVAAQIAAGRNRQDIALASCVSATTVQSQLGAIFDKTGTGGQRELELLIRDLTPPVGKPETAG